jgi:hypothetical protein
MGVHRIVLFFCRGALADLTIYYSSPIQGPQAWISGPHGERVLKCAGLELQVADTNLLRMMKLGYHDEVESRQKAEQDDKRKTFHP